MRPLDIKERLRCEFLERRGQLAFEEVYRLSSRIQKRFIATTYYRSAGRVALYSSFRNEVLTDEIFQDALSSGKRVYFPRITREKKHLSFCRIAHPGDLRVGSYDILEPCDLGDTQEPEGLDLVVLPGVVFDTGGARLGYGKGYYDMTLSGASCPVVALAFEFQVYDGEIPLEEHDVRVSAIITEERTYECGIGRQGREPEGK